MTLAVLAACALAIQGSEALAAIDSASALAQTACVAPIVLAPALFACVVLRKAPAEPEPSGLGATVGQ